MDLCRDKGCVRLVVPGIEIVMGAPPIPRTKLTKEEASDPNAVRRAYYSQLLGYPVSDKNLEHLP